MEAIVNISQWQLTTSEKSVLNKSLKFATTIKRIPNLDLISPIEEVTLKFAWACADEPRWKMRQVLEKSKPLKSKISKGERLVLKSLQSDENIIQPADKGNATVEMDKVEYSK